MAYRRSLLLRGHFIGRKCYPSFSYVLHTDERKHECPEEKLFSADVSHFFQRRSFGSSINGSAGFAYSQDRISSNSFLLPYSGYAFCRYMSTTVNQRSNEIEVMSDVGDVLTDTTMSSIASQFPAVDEVAIAAADSFPPVKVLQYLIDAVHTYTGLNW